MIHRVRTYLSGAGLGPVLIKAVSGSVALRIVGMLFGFLVGIQLARGLGAEGYGIYGVAMSIIALLTVPTEFGLPQLLTREVAAAQVNKDWGRLKGILHWSSMTSLRIAIVIAIATIAWLMLSGTGLSSPLGLTLLAGVVMVPVVAQVSMQSAALRGLQHIVAGQLPDVLLRPVFYSLLLFALPMWIMPLDPVVAMVLGSLSACMAMFIARWLLERSLTDDVAGKARVIDARSWWSSALPMALAEGMRLLQGNLQILLLGVLVVMSEVGIYRMASSMMLLIAMPVSMFNIVTMPIIARLHAANERERLQRMLGLTAAGMTLGVVIMIIPFLLQGQRILSVAFGAEFGEGNLILVVLCGSALINAMFGVGATLLNMTGHQSQVTRASLVALVCLAVLSYPLILFFGSIGAAIAHVVSTLLWSLIMWIAARTLLGLDSSLMAVLPGRFPKPIANKDLQ